MRDREDSVRTRVVVAGHTNVVNPPVQHGLDLEVPHAAAVIVLGNKGQARIFSGVQLAYRVRVALRIVTGVRSCSTSMRNMSVSLAASLPAVESRVPG